MVDELLSETTVADYVRAIPELARRIDIDSLVEVSEIGDGNLNLVFRLRDTDDRGLILKQAPPYVRMTGEGWPMTPERARREAESLQVHHALVPELVCEPIRYDAARHVLALEDLSDHVVWRQALNDGQRHEGVADAMGRFVGAVASGTSVLGLDRSRVAEQIARTQNPELCVITEDLVFTEPVFDIGRNSVLEANAPDAAVLAADPAVRSAMAEAKWRFMTQAEALIHGDLHTGSIMVRKPAGSNVADSVKVFDSEFAFYGPVAFDLGALFANYIFAAARAVALGDDERAQWAVGLIEQTWRAFDATTVQEATSWQSSRLWGVDFARARLERWHRESWLFASAKLARRIVGAAKVRDIEALAPRLREGAARGVLTVSRHLARAWDTGHDADELANIVMPILIEARTR